MRHHAILHNIIQYLSILCNSMQYHTIPFQFYAIVCNTTQYQVQLQKAQFTRSSVCRSTEWIVRLFRRSKYRWMGKTKKTLLKCVFETFASYSLLFVTSNGFQICSSHGLRGCQKIFLISVPGHKNLKIPFKMLAGGYVSPMVYCVSP